jgi:hypothetical protein
MNYKWDFGEIPPDTLLHKNIYGVDQTTNLGRPETSQLKTVNTNKQQKH